MERKERLSVRETRSVLIETGYELFLEPRTDWALGRLSLGTAIERANVSRSSAYRAFVDGDSEPQDEFKHAVLLEVISRVTADTSIVGEVLASLGPNDFESTPDGQAAELREVIRRWTNMNLQTNLQSGHIRAVDVCRVVVGLSPDPDRDILAAIQGSLELARSEWHPFIAAMADRYGIRPQSWTSLDRFQRMLASIEGMAMVDWTIDETSRVIVRPTGPDGADQEWTESGVLTESLALSMYEEDPEAETSANLKSWLD